MKWSSVKYYLSKLINDGHKWQNINVSGIEEKPKLYFSNTQFVFIIISIANLFLIKTGFNKDFIGYIIASLSIFVGLFLTLILTVFDKFQQINFRETNLSEKQKAYLIQKKNFFKQFTALTSYSIVLSILCIFLLSISLLSEIFSTNVFHYSFIESFEEINWENSLTFLGLTFIIVYRFLVIYFFLDFLLMVIYGLGSIYTYITLEYDKTKITK